MFTYNNTPHSSTQQSPFFLNYGFHPRWDELQTNNLTLPSTQVLVKNLKRIHDECKINIYKSQERYKAQADKKRIHSPEYDVGDDVWLKAANIKTTRPSKKFSEKKYGPFTVLEKISSTAYKLELTKDFEKIHPVFHVSLLEPVKKSALPNRHNQPPPPVTIDGTDEYEVEEILAKRTRMGQLQYRVKWRGYDGTEEETTWEPAANLEGAPDLIREFEAQQSHHSQT